jgi:hypothetical protein
LKKSEPNNHGSGYVKKNQNQRTAGFGYFKNLKRTAGFHERTGKEVMFCGQLFDFVKE